MEVSCQLHAPAILPIGKYLRYKFHIRTGGLEGRFRSCWKVNPNSLAVQQRDPSLHHLNYPVTVCEFGYLKLGGDECYESMQLKNEREKKKTKMTAELNRGI